MEDVYRDSLQDGYNRHDPRDAELQKTLAARLGEDPLDLDDILDDVLDDVLGDDNAVHVNARARTKAT
jgi:hypothetical protein